MIYNCVHTFTIEAKDADEFVLLMQRYKQFLQSTSERMDMGYANQAITGNPRHAITEPA